MKIMITGASGFVGSAMVERLLFLKKDVLAVVRKTPPTKDIAADQLLRIGDITASTDWSSALEGVSVVVHCAARVHVMNESVTDPLFEFRKVNVEGTLNLAREAANAAVKRFIFISSIKVNGESTRLDNPFATDDLPMPVDPYGISKMEAEEGLRKIASETGMEVVIIRPVLVYGPGVKANFDSMMSWLYKGVPLPFGAVQNKRSLVALDNLIDLIITCIDHPAAANQTFLVSDGEDLSTTDLLRRMGTALGKPARLISIPVSILYLAAILIQKKKLASRVLGSLVVDSSETRRKLGWVPPVGVDEALLETAKYFLEYRTK